MPRNSRLLLAWFRLQTGKLPVDSSHDFSIFGTIAEDLRWGLEPADLRAAMLRALALMPGVVVVGNMPTPSSPVATLSITGDGHTQQLTLDTDSGRVVGTETIDPQGNHGVDIFPKGIPTDVTTVKTVVVNGLPYLLEPKRDQ
jgi:RNA polymerase sigma-70 factor (ECF subfamily)